MANFEFIYTALSEPSFDNDFKEIHSKPDETREDFLKNIFSVRREFFHRQSLYIYMPAPQTTWVIGGIAGYVGKATKVIRSLGPDELFALTSAVEWNASFLVADYRSDRQIVTMENKQKVGSCTAVLASLFKAYIDDTKPSVTWISDFTRLSSTHDFWEAANKHKGNISKITFEFNQHNGLSSGQKFAVFKEVDKEVKAQTNSMISNYTIENKAKGVVAEGEMIEQAARYAAEGGGCSIIKSGARTLFNSKKNPKQEPVSELEMPRQGEAIKIVQLVKRFMAMIH